MDDRWYKNSIIYEVDVRSFADSDGDGTGDLRGLEWRLGLEGTWPEAPSSFKSKSGKDQFVQPLDLILYGGV